MLAAAPLGGQHVEIGVHQALGTHGAHGPALIVARRSFRLQLRVRDGDGDLARGRLDEGGEREHRREGETGQDRHHGQETEEGRHVGGAPDYA